MKKLFTVLLIIFITISSLSGCAEKKHTETFYAMDTVMTITAYGKNAEKATEKAYNEVVRIEKLLSVTDENSEIYALNHRIKTVVSSETASLIKKAIEISRETDGAFDITLYPLSDLWGFTTKNYRVPDKNEIMNTLNFCGWDEINISSNKINLPEGFLIDLGGIAKGYTAEKIKYILRKEGIKSAVISLGGNIQTIGQKENGKPWKIGIADPFGNETENYVEVCDSAVVTSGGYQRNFVSDGITYHHIIDPKTGYPSYSDIASVTVICESGTKADALSTAFFVMGKEKTLEFCERHSGISAVIIMQNGEVINVK